MQVPETPDTDETHPAHQTLGVGEPSGCSVTAAAEEGGVPARVQATLAGWHVQGAQRTDPVRFALIESMARRALRHHGPARALLDARLAELVDGYEALLRARGIPPLTAPAGDGVAPLPAPAAAERGPLGWLVAEIAGQVPAPVPRGKSSAAERAGNSAAAPGARSRAGGGRASAKGTPARAEPAALPEIDLETVALHSAAAPAASLELASVRRFRGTWSRLSAQERLRQTFEQVPPQAGPLNALHLLHRALVQMQELSPDYLQHFVAHVDALLWLEQVHQAAQAPSAARSSRSARAIASRRKTPGAKR